jgi:ElaB/YqjD/DUF883 family membrane-anchored ribosome-binding protein
MESKETVMGNADESRSTPLRGVSHVTVGANDTITSVSDAAGPAVERVASGAHEIVDRVAGVATRAAETLGIKGEQLKSAEKQIIEGAREYVNQHPIASLGIAMAAGYVLSRLLSSK